MSTMYVSPTGSGNKSGSDWANAATINNLDSLIKKAGAGGTVLLLADAGDYKVNSQISITANMAGSGVTVKGVGKSGADMDAHIVGTRPAVYAAANPAGNELFKFQAGSGNLTFKNLLIENTGTAFRAAGDTHDITIRNVDAKNVAWFFEDYVGGSNTTATVSGLTLKDVNVNGFSKGVVRLQYDSHDIVIEDVFGDSQRQDGQDFAMGVHLDGTAHDVFINRTTMQNITDTTNKYQNGDGFATERGVYNVVFQDTVSRGNTDGGYDLKSSNTTLIRTFAEDNSRNYRVWGQTDMIDVVGLNPNKRGGELNSQGQVWVSKAGKLTIDGGYFADAGSGTKVFMVEGTGKVTVTDIEVVYASTAKLSIGTAVTGLSAADVTKVDAVGYTSVGADMDKLLAKAPAGEAQPTPTAPIDSGAGPKDVVNKFTSSSANQTFTAGAGSDRFVFDQSKKMGADTIKGFGGKDLLQTVKALPDGNGDGLIAFGKNGLLDLGSGSGTVKIEGKAGLRSLGSLDGYYAYGDASVRPTAALEGRLGAADKLAGDKGDKKATTFFVDNALGVQLGDDTLSLFGRKDVLVTTAKLADISAGAVISATAGKFNLAVGGAQLGSLAISETAGATVAALEFDGAVALNGHQYYVYSIVGTTAGITTVPH